MAEPSQSRLWLMRAAYVGLCTLIILFHLLPLETTPRRWVAPDLLLALSFVWVTRRPDLVPILSIAFVMLLADLLLQRPPGAWAALTVGACEWLRRRGPALREMPFAAEWGNVAVATVGVILGYRLLLGLTMTGQAALSLSMIQMMMTLAAYPFVALVSQFVFGIRKFAPGEVNALGHRT